MITIPQPQLQMDEHAMSSGIVPVRYPSYLPGVVKLPRRYEKAALGDSKTTRYRKVSVCGEPVHMRQGISARLDDLMTAIMWVKQELILLRQHDILLKRQFFDIHDSILSLQTPRKLASALASSTSSLSNSLSVNGDMSDGYEPLSSSLTVSAMSRLARTPSSLSLSSSPATSPFLDKRNKRVPPPINGVSKTASPNFGREPIHVRPSSSATVLNNKDDDSDDTDGDDTFDEAFFRPRTSSMRTSRDLAALARRRGSKELI